MDVRNFEDDLLRFIRELCRREGIESPVTADTPLFEGKLIDSRRVVDLIEFVERALGIVVPDQKLSMQYFRTPSAIAREFAETARSPWPTAPTDDPPPPPLLTFEAEGARPTRDGVTALVRSGDLLATESGSVVFRGAALALHDYFTGLFGAVARDVAAQGRRYPTLVQLSDLERTDYFKSFPQHAVFCTSLQHDTTTLQHFVTDVKSGHEVPEAVNGRLEAPQMVLSSAVCYHCYHEFAGRTLDAPLTLLTAQGQCFRNERGAFRALDRQYEFTMREVVLIGKPARIGEKVMELIHTSVDVVAALGFTGTVERANDFFFRGDVDGRGRALHQQARALKYELRVRTDDAGPPLALASFNLHEDYFGRRFGISLADDAPASTGCVGFGIERWVSAFLAYHGADPARWPSSVRDACFPNGAIPRVEPARGEPESGGWRTAGTLAGAVLVRALETGI